MEAMHYAKLCIRRQGGYTLLYIALKNGHTEVATMLVERGADMNQADDVNLLCGRMVDGKRCTLLTCVSTVRMIVHRCTLPHARVTRR